jgi:MoaA/NifB/PqqE/SkfB family radical SAM enzyme
MLKHSYLQFIFGIRVFFSRLTPRNTLRIIKFIVKRNILGKPIPFSVVLALTYRCQCDCVHCSVGDYERKNNELTTQEVKSLFDFIDSWGPLKVTFFGGEPLLRVDIVELVRYAYRKGIRTSLDTNGILLDERKVCALKKSGISNINVSIDSHDGSKHDFLRKNKGCFEAAVRAIKLCVKHKVPCLVSTYASRRAIKENDIEKIILLAKNTRAKGVKILFPILSGKWREAQEQRLDDQEKAYIERLLDPSFVYIEDALEMVKSRGKGCSALSKNLIYVSPYGDIMPCPAIPLSFGNIRDGKMNEIIQKMYKHELFKKYKSCKNCLMNEDEFRRSFFYARSDKEMPLDVAEIKL